MMILYVQVGVDLKVCRRVLELCFAFELTCLRVKQQQPTAVFGRQHRVLGPEVLHGLHPVGHVQLSWVERVWVTRQTGGVIALHHGV